MHVDGRVRVRVRRWSWILVGLIALLPVGVMAQQTISPGIPAMARLQAPVLCKHLVVVFGQDPPCATLLGLVEQESSFVPTARSRLGALGPGQFMPGTMEKLVLKYPILRPANPTDWAWSAMAIALLWKELMDQYRPLTDNECSASLMMLSGYNGGPTALNRERALCQVDGPCNSQRWFFNVELQKSRAQWAFDENRDYVWKVYQRANKYASAGFGRTFCQ